MLVTVAEFQLPEGFTYVNEGNYPLVRVTQKYALLSAIIVEEELRSSGYTIGMVEVDPRVEDDVEEIRFVFDLLFFTREQFKECMNLISRTLRCFDNTYTP